MSHPEDVDVPLAKDDEANLRPAWWRGVATVATLVVFVLLNFLAWQWLHSPIGQEILTATRDYGAVALFLVMLLANATIIVQIPWPAIAIPLAAHSPNLPLLLTMGALGSVLGESVAFAFGRLGRGIINDTSFYRWVQRQLSHPLRSALLLFFLSAVPNPLFDVAGLTAGAAGLPYWLFFLTVFAGRVVRLWATITFVDFARG